MFVTSMSVPGVHLDCSVKTGATIEEKVRHAFKLLINFGLHINGIHSCGDYIFSGHTSST